jgi:adhesin/invasin
MMMLDRKPLGTIGALVCAALVAAACDKAPLFAPTNGTTPSTITVTTSSLVLQVGGTAEVLAFVVEPAGTPVQNGTSVLFNATLGAVNPVEALTRDGVARTTFTANASGSAQITAASGTAKTATPLEIKVGAAAAGSVTVIATPSSVPPSGGTINIDAFAIDTNGNRIVGVPISFSTTAGTLSSGTAVPDALGNARVQLTTNVAATVTARVGTITGTVNVTVATAISLLLATAPNPAIAGQPMTLTVTPAAGTAPRVVVSWGDGDTQDLGILSAARGVTHTYANPGVYSINATATGQGDSFSTSTTVSVGARPAPTITVSPATGTTAQTFTFTVTPSPNTAVRNVRIDFGDGNSRDLGPITSATPVTKTYSSADTYVAQVTQTDSSGATSTGAVAVTVTRAP